MSDFLQEMAEHSYLRAQDAKQRTSLLELKSRCEELDEPVLPMFMSGQLNVIAEIKRHSPAEGSLQQESGQDGIIKIARSYLEGGAAALSVLTEPSRFNGSLTDLQSIAALAHAMHVPVMRKDFLVDEYQIYEARLSGADGVLLITRLLDDKTLEKLLTTADQLGMFVLLEAFDRQDLERMQAFRGVNHLMGLNCRDLTTLKINPNRFKELASDFPANVLRIAESGINSVDDAVAVHQLGYDGVLMGTALMKASSPVNLLSAIRSATSTLQKGIA